MLVKKTDQKYFSSILYKNTYSLKSSIGFCDAIYSDTDCSYLCICIFHMYIFNISFSLYYVQLRQIKLNSLIHRFLSQPIKYRRKVNEAFFNIKNNGNPDLNFKIRVESGAISITNTKGIIRILGIHQSRCCKGWRRGEEG